MSTHPPSPLAWERIRDDLLAQVEDGRLGVGDRIPSLEALAAAHDVSRAPARAAIQALQEAGVLVGRRGAGVFVVAKPADAVPAEVDDRSRLAQMEERIRELTERVQTLEDRQAGTL